jgi:hypothetical protein
LAACSPDLIFWPESVSWSVSWFRDQEKARTRTPTVTKESATLKTGHRQAAEIPTSKKPAQHTDCTDGNNGVQQWSTEFQTKGGTRVVYIGQADNIANEGDRTMQDHRVDDDGLADLVEDQHRRGPPEGNVAETVQRSLFSSALLLQAIH